MDAYDAIATRRSLRRLDTRPVPRELIDKLLGVGVRAPAPHHTKPWRFIVLETKESRARLAEAMGEAWRRDLERDGVALEKIAGLLAKSRRQIEEAPALLLSCLVRDGLRDWPDERRQRAEWGMAQQSMGAALENVMVAAHALGLASYWISAPLFCPDAVREALDLSGEYVSQALVVVGYPAPGIEPRPRAEPDGGSMVERR
jgi:coenzyme F420-0:L-glutamate ligase / coenzyme F420-1:gamma-L-glutamate ligase